MFASKYSFFLNICDVIKIVQSYHLTKSGLRHQSLRKAASLSGVNDVQIIEKDSRVSLLFL